MQQDIGRGEAICRRTDHWLPAGSGDRPGGGRAMPRAGLSETSYLPQEHKFVGTNVSDAKHLNGLEKENARLKRLLAEAMLENEVTKDALRKSGVCTSHTRTGVPHGQSRLERTPLVTRHWYER